MTPKKLLLVAAFLLISRTGYCAIAYSSLTGSFSTTDATSYTTASITPTANALVLLTVLSVQTGGPPVPTVTGNGLTWVEEESNLNTTTNNRRITIFRAMGASPSTGTITIDFAGNTQARCIWSVSEYTGVDTSGTNGSGAIVQKTETSATPGNATSVTLTLSAFSDTSNMAYGAMWLFSAEDITNGSGFTSIYENSSGEGAQNMSTEYKLNDNTVDWSWTSNVTYGAIALEIAVAPAGGGGGTPGQNMTKIIIMGNQ